MSKPIHITSSEYEIHALCNDGSIWKLDLLEQEQQWLRLPDIPQEDAEDDNEI